MNKKMISEIREQQDLEEEYSEGSDDSIGKDIEMNRALKYPSDLMPQDFFQYKKLRIIPEAHAEYKGLIDKDLTFSHVEGRKPSLQKVRYDIETIDLMKNIFVIEKEVPVWNEETNDYYRDDGGKVVLVKRFVFDDFFNPIVSMLTVGFKTELVGSRAMGKDREAVLDITTGIRKESARRREEGQRTYGFGKQ